MSSYEDARLAVPNDIKTIELLLLEHRHNIAGSRGADFYHLKDAPLLTSATLSAVLKDPAKVIVAGTYDDIVFGFALCEISHLLDGSKCATLTHFLVDPEARKVGIAAAMMHFLIEQVKEKGCTKIDSIALPGDRSTKNFFESFGLKARLLIVHKEL